MFIDSKNEICFEIVIISSTTRGILSLLCEYLSLVVSWLVNGVMTIVFVCGVEARGRKTTTDDENGEKRRKQNLTFFFSGKTKVTTHNINQSLFKSEPHSRRHTNHKRTIDGHIV